MPSNPPATPYSSAASAYGDHAQKATSDPREVEARVLLKAANMLQDLQNNWDPENLEKLDEVLKYNRQIWMIFFDTALENKDGNRPTDLRNNIINLANFVFKRTLEILSTPDQRKLDVLITINRDIAAGLMSAAPGSNTGTPPGIDSQATTAGGAIASTSA